MIKYFLWENLRIVWDKATKDSFVSVITFFTMNSRNYGQSKAYKIMIYEKLGKKKKEKKTKYPKIPKSHENIILRLKKEQSILDNIPQSLFSQQWLQRCSGRDDLALLNTVMCTESLISEVQNRTSSYKLCLRP